MALLSSDSRSSLPRSPSAPHAKLRRVRVMFAAYLVVIAAGLGVYITIGLLHR
jgi:hypothetical protein